MPQDEWENLASLLSLVMGIVAALMLWAGWGPRRWIDRYRGWVVKPRPVFEVSGRSRLAIGLLLLPGISLSISMAIAIRDGIPHPIIHDEFSYLLAADTFAHGRLTNPSPPFIEHFETPHELMRPTYMSKYPPGQGLALAVGQVLTREPIAGAWLSTAFAVSAIYWMLPGFVSPAFAVLGGLLAAVDPILVDWSRNYWGGSVAVLGSAILLGAWGRLLRAGSIHSSLLLGAGLVILANTRPYEGGLLATVLLIPLLSRLVHRCYPYRWKLGLPAVAVLLISAAAMGYYNVRVTGHPLRLPIVEYARQYDVYPKFWFLPVGPAPVFHNQSLAALHIDFEKGLYNELRTRAGFLRITLGRTRECFENNLKLMVLFPAFAAAVGSWRRPVVRWLLLALALSLAGQWAENFVQPHYQAPVVPVFFLLVMIGLMRMWEWDRPGNPIGKILVHATVAGFLVGAITSDARPVPREPMLVEQQQFVDHEPRLATGQHLVFVEYAPMHLFRNEYVFNRADLGSSRIIWARSFGPESDLPVARYFTGRKIWLLNVDRGKMTAYLECPHPHQEN